MAKGLRNKEHRQRAGVDDFQQREEKREKARQEERGPVTIVKEPAPYATAVIDYSGLADRVSLFRQTIERSQGVIASAFQTAAEQIAQQNHLSTALRQEPMTYTHIYEYGSARRIEWVDFLVDIGSSRPTIEYVVKCVDGSPMRVGYDHLCEIFNKHIQTFGPSNFTANLSLVLAEAKRRRTFTRSIRVDRDGTKNIPPRIACVDIDQGEPNALMTLYNVSVTFENGDIVGGQDGASLEEAISLIRRDMYFYPTRASQDARLLHRLEQIQRQQRQEFETVSNIPPGTPVVIDYHGRIVPATPEQRNIVGISVGSGLISTSDGTISFPAGTVAEFAPEPAPKQEPKPEETSSPFKHLEI